MSDNNVATNQNLGSDNNQSKQQDPTDLKTNESNQINGKDVIALNRTGTVKWFNVKSGYGFITRDDNKEDVFVHQTAITKNNPQKYFRSVDDGENVEFDIVRGEKGFEAVNVTGPNNTNVRGSKYAADRRQNSPRENNRGGRGDGRPSFYGRGRGGRPPHRTRGGPYRGDREGFHPDFIPHFDSFGPPPMMGPPPFNGPPPRNFPGQMIRSRGRPPFQGDYGYRHDFEGRGRGFRSRGGPIFSGPTGHMPGPMGPPMGGYRNFGRPRSFGRSFGRPRYQRGPYRGNRGNSNNYDEANDNQFERRDAGQ